MNLYLNVGCVPKESPRIGRELLNQIEELGFHGIRVDIPDHHDACWRLLEELAEHPALHPIFLVAGGQMTREHPDVGGPPWSPESLVQHVWDSCQKASTLGFFERGAPPAIEIGNEPDLAHDVWKGQPALLAETFSKCFEKARSFSARCPVLTPSVSNLNSRGFDYLRVMLEAGLPDGCAVAVHRYPNGDHPSVPHGGFASREEEIGLLMDLTGDRDVWVTEAGRSEGPIRRRRFLRPPKVYWLSESDVSDYMEEEVRLWAHRSRVKALVWYQINSGPDHDNELHNYGIRRMDGTLKPVAMKVRALREELS